MYSFDYTTGAMNWAYDTKDFPGHDVESPVVAGVCGTVSCAVLISAATVDAVRGNEVIAIANGTVLFRTPIEVDLDLPFQLFVLESQVLIVSSANGVYAISLSTGKSLWNTPTYSMETAILNQRSGLLYGLTNTSKFVALNASNGTAVMALNGLDCAYLSDFNIEVNDAGNLAYVSCPGSALLLNVPKRRVYVKLLF